MFPFSLLIPLKRSENLWFFDVFRGSNGNIGKNWVKIIQFNTVKPLNSGQSLSVIERCLPLGGNLKRLSHLGQTVLSAFQGMSAIWDVRYWEVSLYYDWKHLNYLKFLTSCLNCSKVRDQYKISLFVKKSFFRWGLCTFWYDERVRIPLISKGTYISSK